jgi:hypothetical protein
MARRGRSVRLSLLGGASCMWEDAGSPSAEVPNGSSSSSPYRTVRSPAPASPVCSGRRFRTNARRATFAPPSGASDGRGYIRIDAADNELRIAADVEIDWRLASAQARRLLLPAAAYSEVDLDPGPLIGEPLPGWYEDWLLGARERHHELRLRALETLCQLQVRPGRHREAIEAGLIAVQGARCGRAPSGRSSPPTWPRGTGVRRCSVARPIVDFLWQELQVEPSQDLQGLVQAIGIAGERPFRLSLHDWIRHLEIIPDSGAGRHSRQ